MIGMTAEEINTLQARGVVQFTNPEQERRREMNRRYQAEWRSRQKKKPNTTHRPEPRYMRRYKKGYLNHPSLKGLIGKDYHTAYMRLYRRRQIRMRMKGTTR